MKKLVLVLLLCSGIALAKTQEKFYFLIVSADVSTLQKSGRISQAELDSVVQAVGEQMKERGYKRAELPSGTTTSVVVKMMLKEQVESGTYYRVLLGAVNSEVGKTSGKNFSEAATMATAQLSLP